MSEQLKTIIFGTLVVTLFAFLLVTTVIEGGEPYGKELSDVENEKLNVSGITRTMQTIQGDAEEWEEQVYGYKKKSIAESVLGFLVSSFFGLLLTIFKVVTAPFKGLVLLLTDVLGLHPAVTSILITVVIISMIFGVYKMIRQGG